MMRTINIMITAIIMATGAYAQTDTINKRMMPPEINNTDGINNNQWNNPDNERGTIDNRKNNDQTPTRKEKQDSTSNKRNNSKISNGYFMLDGKMMLAKDGKTTPMVKNYTYPNGMVFYTDGSYLNQEGKKSKLDNGQHIDNSGKVVTIK